MISERHNRVMSYQIIANYYQFNVNKQMNKQPKCTFIRMLLFWIQFVGKIETTILLLVIHYFPKHVVA